MGSVSSKAPPFPYSAMINGIGVRTRDDLVGKNVLSLKGNVLQTHEYGDEDLYREHTDVFRGPLGMGESIQQANRYQRYRYGLNAWFSGNQRGKGPRWNGLSPTTTGPIRDFIQALHGGVLTQFILAERYILRRAGDTSGGQVVSHDFGAGLAVTSAARFKPVGGSDRLYVTLNNGDLWNYDGTTWNGPATAADTWAGTAYLCTVVDNDFYIKDTQNTVRRCTADPMLGASYSGQFETADFGSAGDGSLTITGIIGHNRILWIFTDSGKVFTLNPDGTSNDLYPGLQMSNLPTNGQKPAGDSMGNLYFRNGSSWFRIDPSGILSPIGPERILSRDGEVNGVAQVFTWHEAYYGFFGLYNTTNNSSYLLQFGDYLPGQEADGFVFVESFNGALVKWPGKQISALDSQYIDGIPRLYCGFSDGTYGYIRLPQNTPNPFAEGSGCEFADGSTGLSEVYWPRHTMMKPRDLKTLLDVSVFGPHLDADNTVTVSVQCDFKGVYDFVGIANQNALHIEPPFECIAAAFDVKETFNSPTSTTTPVIESLILRQELRPAFRMEWLLNIPVRHYTPLRNGGSSRMSPETLKDLIRDAAEDPGGTDLLLPDETVQGFSLITYQEVIPADTKRYGMEWELQVSFVAYRTIELFGTIDRLGTMTIDDLGSLTIDDLGIL